MDGSVRQAEVVDPLVELVDTLFVGIGHDGDLTYALTMTAIAKVVDYKRPWIAGSTLLASERGGKLK